MSRDACAKTGCGQSRDHAFHVWYQQATGGHHFVEPTESSDEATVPVNSHAAAVDYFSESCDKPSKESLGRFLGEYGGRMFKVGFAAGRAAACTHDLASIAAGAHGKGQKQAIKDVVAWLLEIGAEEPARKLETGEWHRECDAISRAGGTTK